MSEYASLARPYVRAVFDVARSEGDLAAWSDQLALLATVTGDSRLKELDGHPRIGRDRFGELIIDICGDALSPKAKNLVRLLAHNRRLAVCGEIASQYERLRAEAENTIEAEIESATEIDDERKARIAQALTAKLGRAVSLTCTTNPELIGGAVIRTGDWVYDGSVREQLEKMAAAMNA